MFNNLNYIKCLIAGKLRFKTIHKAKYDEVPEHYQLIVDGVLWKAYLYHPTGGRLVVVEGEIYRLDAVKPIENNA